jgi:predicted nucleotidyltransferase component of viral defense system
MSLVLKCLPIVALEADFILKGGTAINLFIREDFPRISVDIDVTYLPVQDRLQSLHGVEKGLKSIAANLKRNMPKVIINEHYNRKMQIISRLDVSLDNTSIKVEPNMILRGCVFAPIKSNLSKAVGEQFSVAITEQPVASTADIYGGKLCAALDRQHPRDLFDVKLLLESIGITKEIKQAFIVYLCSHNRPMHELLAPNLLDQRAVYNSEFVGMENKNVSYAELEKARVNLLGILKNRLSNDDKEFILSVHQGKPKWAKIGLDNRDDLPGIKWKLLNIAKMDKDKYSQELEELTQVLSDFV